MNKSVFRTKYESFVRRAKDCGGVWALVSSRGPLQTKVIDEKWALALWDSEAAAEAFCSIKDIHDYWAEFVSINVLLDDVLPSAYRQGLDIHPNPQDEPVGLTVPADGLLNNLRI